MEGLINPLQEQIEEWKKGVNTLDKDYAKGTEEFHTHSQSYIVFNIFKEC